MKPKNYLVESILVTIFCCLPLGIVGIVFASQVNSAYEAGDEAKALENSKKAKQFTLIGFIIGIVQYLIVGIVYGAAILAAIGSGSY